MGWRDPNICLGVEGGEKKCSNEKRKVVTFEMGRRGSHQRFYEELTIFPFFDIYMISIMNSSVNTPEKNFWKYNLKNEEIRYCYYYSTGKRTN